MAEAKPLHREYKNNINKILSKHIVTIDTGDGVDRNIPGDAIDELADELLTYLVVSNPYIIYDTEKKTTKRQETKKTEIKLVKPLSGKEVVFTGPLRTCTRSGATRDVELRGGHVANSISSHTDYLVATRHDTSKFKAAEETMGDITIIDEEEFVQMLRSNPVLGSYKGVTF